MNYYARLLSILGMLLANVAWLAADEPKPSQPAAAASAPAESEKPDDEAILGTWRLKTADEKKVADLNETLQAIRLTFDVGTFKFAIVTDGGSQEVTGTYAIDSKVTPKTLDATVNTDNTVFAIYELDKDTLKIRIKGDSQERPVDFVGGADGGTILTFDRDKGQE